MQRFGIRATRHHDDRRLGPQREPGLDQNPAIVRAPQPQIQNGQIEGRRTLDQPHPTVTGRRRIHRMTEIGQLEGQRPQHRRIVVGKKHGLARYRAPNAQRRVWIGAFGPNRPRQRDREPAALTGTRAHRQRGTDQDA